MVGYSLHIASYMYELTDNESRGLLKRINALKKYFIA